MLNYGAPSWFYREISEFVKQMVVRELLLGQCCDGLFAIVGGKTVGLQYPVWLLCNIDCNVKTRTTTNVCLHVLCDSAQSEALHSIRPGIGIPFTMLEACIAPAS